MWAFTMHEQLSNLCACISFRTNIWDKSDTLGCDLWHRLQQKPCGVTAGWFLWVGTDWAQLKMLCSSYTSLPWDYTHVDLSFNCPESDLTSGLKKRGIQFYRCPMNLVLPHFSPVHLSKWAHPVLCSMSSWCCCGLWVWPRLHGRAVSSLAPVWMRTPVFYQFIRGLDAAQGLPYCCRPVKLLP